MCVCGNDISVLHNTNFVGVHYRLQAMCNDKDGLSLDYLGNGGIHFLLVFGILISRTVIAVMTRLLIKGYIPLHLINVRGITATEIKALTYITNPLKTQGGRLVDSFNCSRIPELASKDFEEIRASGSGRNKNLSHHIIVSFEGEEITPDKAMEFGNELCRRFLKNEYQYVLAVHTDTDNVHCHIIFNLDDLETRAREAVDRQVEKWLKSDKEYQAALMAGDEVKAVGLKNGLQIIAMDMLRETIINV